jgi:hypothetical protein
MRWTRALVGVVASLASFATSATTNDDVPGESERGLTASQRLETTGYAASGPSFYVWEEDPRQGRQWRAELSLASRSATRPSVTNSRLPKSG